ncbi:MAG: PAS domain S-box protein [Deltaproteobacteria bacterium]|nr:PAS domain S-box protein [Deltaproteobacteria bacterium]
MDRYSEVKEAARTEQRIAEEVIGLRRRIAKLVAGANESVALQRNKQLADRYRDLVDNLPDVVVELNGSARITFISSRCVSVFGYRPEELVGKPFGELLSPRIEQSVPWTLDSILDIGKETIGDLRARHKQGYEIWVRVTVAHLGREASPTVVVILSDITDRVKTAQALIESKQKYRALFGGLPDSITILDLKGRVLEGKEFYGLPAERILGRRFTDIGVLPPEYSEYGELLLAELVAGKRIGPVELEIVDVNKERRWIEVYVSCIESEGKPLAIQVITRDIGKRKKLEERLLESQKMEAVGRLAGGMAHDFNNQLMVILNSTEMLRRSLQENDPRMEKVNLIRLAAEHSASLTQQLLAFSRKQIVEPVVLDLNRALRELHPMLATAVGNKIAFCYELEEKLDAVRIDPAQVQRVIVNLVLNARDAMPEGGTVTLRTANRLVDQNTESRMVSPAPGPYVTLSVADTGYGMDEATQRRAFEPFYTTKEPGKGTGLGLSTVYGAVKQSGGEIQLESRRGVGTVFTIYLPRVEGEAVAVQQEGKPAAEARRSERAVLLIEDDPNVRETTKMILEDGGYRVHTADNPDKGVKLYQTHHRDIDVVLSDVVMPGMSVRDLTERLTSIEPAVKILFVSGYSEQVVVERGVLDPTVNFLRKPFSLDQLMGKVAALIGT